MLGMKKLGSRNKNIQRQDTGFLDKVLVFVINNKSLFILIILAIVAQISSGGLFFRGSNLSSVVRQTAVMCLMSLGFTVVLSSGNLDLSVGNMLSLLCIVYATLSLTLPLWLAILITFAIGALCGLLNAFFAIRLGLTPFVLTLATAEIFRGAAYLLCGGIAIGGMSNQVKFLGQGTLFGILPISFLIVLVLFFIISIMLSRTKFGRHIVAVGGNQDAAKVSGINVKFIKAAAFVIMGLCNAMAAIVVTGRISFAMPSVGDGMSMDAIAAVVIGGTSMNGGKPNVMGSILGCFILGIISNLLNLAGVSSFWQWVSKGVIIIAAIFFDSKTDSFFNKRALNKEI